MILPVLVIEICQLLNVSASKTTRWLIDCLTDTGLKPEFSKEIVSCEPISKSIFELTELIYTCLSEVRHSRQPMTGNDLLGVYTKYLKWYESAFECLRKGGVCSPSVLFLQ